MKRALALELSSDDESSSSHEAPAKRRRTGSLDEVTTEHARVTRKLAMATEESTRLTHMQQLLAVRKLELEGVLVRVPWDALYKAASQSSSAWAAINDMGGNQCLCEAEECIQPAHGGLVYYWPETGSAPQNVRLCKECIDDPSVCREVLDSRAPIRAFPIESGLKLSAHTYTKIMALLPVLVRHGDYEYHWADYLKRAKIVAHE